MVGNLVEGYLGGARIGRYWDLFIVLLVLWNCGMIPVEIAFEEFLQGATLVVITARTMTTCRPMNGHNRVSVYLVVPPSVILAVRRTIRHTDRPFCCLYVRPTVYPSICPTFRLSVRPSYRLFVVLSVRPSVVSIRPPAHPPARPTDRPSDRLTVRPF